jgi:predicted DNA repair protein MutK
MSLKTTTGFPMPSGLAALLDDIAGIAKLAAASIDDVGAAAAKAGTKAAGVVIDDTAVTPTYVTGFTPDRELPIIWKIAVGSLRNKMLFLLPAALLLSAFAPFLITPILMIGGAYLCFEGAEKVIHALSGHHAGEDLHPEAPGADGALLEEEKVGGAIRTDFILSGEIMAIALAEVADQSIWSQAASLALVAFAVTAGVYGVVALIVKLDDIGVHLAKNNLSPFRALGRGLVEAMPWLLRFLSVIGTAAMIWVGGGIIVHGLHATPHFIAEVGGGSGFIHWLADAGFSGVVGLAIGGVIALIVGAIQKARGKAAA